MSRAVNPGRRRKGGGGGGGLGETIHRRDKVRGVKASQKRNRPTLEH